jgi:4-hydroxysphinganine ceramide fatty acyl 2-hydroxylase
LAVQAVGTSQGTLARPYQLYKKEQELISRRKIIRTTAFYVAYLAMLMFLAFRADHLGRALLMVPAGVVLWIFGEYFSHRYILHSRIRPAKDPLKSPFRYLGNKFLDPLHWEHHERPFDGDHISGRLRDALPVWLVFSVVAILAFPIYTASVVVAVFFVSYAMEEWIHHATHYYNFRSKYFRYIKKHHMYHHTRQGMNQGFGLSSGIGDFIFGTRFPQHVRDRLYGRKTTLASDTSAAAEV